MLSATVIRVRPWVRYNFGESVHYRRNEFEWSLPIRRGVVLYCVRVLAI